jgi:hypothetical protein
MLTAIIPDPDMINHDFRTEVYGDDPKELCANIRAHIVHTGYGASDIGANFNVYRDGNIVGTATFNGKFHWRDPAYAA